MIFIGILCLIFINPLIGIILISAGFIGSGNKKTAREVKELKKELRKERVKAERVEITKEKKKEKEVIKKVKKEEDSQIYFVRGSHRSPVTVGTDGYRNNIELALKMGYVPENEEIENILDELGIEY